MANPFFTPPEDLTEAGLRLWNIATRRRKGGLKSVDYTALHMACVWIDRFFNASKDDDKSTDVKMGIATDKFLLISACFGFTPNDRRKIGFGAAKKPKAAEKRTKLEDLKPGILGARNGTH